jgi:hypothetical protein
MKAILLVLFLIAMFHLSLYYCNVNLFSSSEDKLSTESMDELSETKEEMEKYLNELKQYDSLNKHG